jgi:hypothetical protein
LGSAELVIIDEHPMIPGAEPLAARRRWRSDVRARHRSSTALGTLSAQHRLERLETDRREREAALTGELSDAQRRDVLGRTGASPAAVDELMASSAGDGWWPNRPVELAPLPLADDPFVEAWTVYAADAERTTAYEALRGRIVQLSFPIRSGISAEEHYRAATLKGSKPDAASTLELEEPDGLTLIRHP